MNLLQDAADQLHYPEFNGESLKFEGFFQFALEQLTEVIVLGENLSKFQYDKLETVAENVYFFEFSGFFQKILTRTFLSVRSIWFCFQTKISTKVHNECCLIENPKAFFNLDCKQCLISCCLIYFFVFRCKLVKICEDEEFSLLQITVRFPELRFKYMRPCSP